MIYSAEAPSNIALIKYMGKVGASNTPGNSSISLSLPMLRSRVEIHPNQMDTEMWQPLNQEGWRSLSLDIAGQEKFLNFFLKLKNRWSIPGKHKLYSANNFPGDCGIASSASSFAALTLSTYKLACSYNPGLDLTAADLGQISREGSGSSARSFISPICEWHADGRITEFKDSAFNFLHQIIVVDSEKKSVSSSEAHKRINSSYLFASRFQRAETRLIELKKSLTDGDWKVCYQLLKEEFWDMHGLFHTARPSFQYITPKSLEVLAIVDKYWKSSGDGPWVTMDAGANVHLIYRNDQKDMMASIRGLVGSDRVMQGI